MKLKQRMYLRRGNDPRQSTMFARKQVFTGTFSLLFRIKFFLVDYTDERNNKLDIRINMSKLFLTCLC